VFIQACRWFRWFVVLGQLYPVNIWAKKEVPNVEITTTPNDLKNPPSNQILDLQKSFMMLRSQPFLEKSRIQLPTSSHSLVFSDSFHSHQPIDPGFSGLGHLYYNNSGINADPYVQSIVRFGLASNSMQYFVLVGSQSPNPFSLNSLSQQNGYTSVGLGVHYAFNDSWSAELGTMVYLPHTTTSPAPSSVEELPKESLSSLADVQEQVKGLSKTGIFSFSETFFRVVYYFCKE
jgi:hypothetical protein